MPTTDNGWSASPDLDVRPLIVAGESFSPGVRDDDDVWTVLRYVAEQVHERVERIWAPGWHEADDWGFSYRPNANNPNSLSRHSGGIAIDYNATRHPNGVPTTRTFTATQIREIHTILGEVEQVVRWGGDYTGTPDAMHFEINTPPGSPALARVADRIRNEEDTMQEADWTRLRAIVREEVTAELDRPIEVAPAPDGRERRRSLRQMVKETWQKRTS